MTRTPMLWQRSVWTVPSIIIAFGAKMWINSQWFGVKGRQKTISRRNGSLVEGNVVIISTAAWPPVSIALCRLKPRAYCQPSSQRDSKC